MRNWWQRRTLRLRLGLWYAGVGMLLLAAYSAAIYFFVAQSLAVPIGSRLRDDDIEVRSHLTISPDGGALWDGRPLTVEEPGTWNGPWFELWDPNEQLVVRMWPFNDSQLDQLPPMPDLGRETIEIFDISPNIALRTLTEPLAGTGSHAGWTLRVMRLNESSADALTALLAIIISALPLMLALLVAGGFFLTRRWLRPLDEMVTAAEGITAHGLGRRLPVANPADELGILATAFNFTLQKLDDSFVTLQRFVADASHELRTPLTTLRSVGEVGLRRGRSEEEYREIIGSMLEESQRLQQLINRLLELAQAEGGTQRPQDQEIRLDRFVTGCVNDLSVLAEQKEVKLVVRADPFVIHSDPVILRQALQNLIDNAIKYSPPKSTVTIDTMESARGYDICVVDRGPGIDEEDRPRLAARFFRPASSRARDEPGYGLGLAITRAYMGLLGGFLEYEPMQPHGSRFRLVLPRERPPSAPLPTAP